MGPLSKKQNFYQLFCIQSISLGLPVILIGKQLSILYGIKIAICSMFIGNLLLWLVAFGIISTVFVENTNAIENIKGYIGKGGAILFAVVLVAAFMNWYVIQINKSIIGLQSIFQYSYPWETELIVRFGAAFSLIIALLAVGGIQLLKWLTSIAFPIIVAYSIYAVALSDFSMFEGGKWGFALPGVFATLVVLLPGIINLPTFFRHSKSRSHSYLALTCMTIVIFLFECSSILMSFSPHSEYVSSVAPSFSTFVVPTAVFLILSGISSNLLNIYLASACFETFIPRFEGGKGYVLMGLIGTAMYTFVQISSPVQFFEGFVDCYIVVIGVVLIVAVLSRIIVQHRPRRFEKIINVLAWLLGCVVSTISLVRNSSHETAAILYGMGASFLFYIIIFFIEETIWSIQKLNSKESVEKVS